MRPWKAVLGVGVACAACCAVPLLGGVAALATGSTALAALGSTLLAFGDPFLLLAVVLMTFAAAGGWLVWWRLRVRRKAQERPGGGGRCTASGMLPPQTAAPGKPCGCAPGACG